MINKSYAFVTQRYFAMQANVSVRMFAFGAELNVFWTTQQKLFGSMTAPFPFIAMILQKGISGHGLSIEVLKSFQCKKCVWLPVCIFREQLLKPLRITNLMDLPRVCCSPKHIIPGILNMFASTYKANHYRKMILVENLSH